MESLERFYLRWDAFEANTIVAIKELREEKEFLDVTLVSGDGKQVQANKVFLAGRSSFFLKILKENPHPHPLIFLKGVSFEHLLRLLDFIYTGEAIIVQGDLNDFLDIAEDLKVKGLRKNDTSGRVTGKLSKSRPTTPAPLQSDMAYEELGPSPSMSHPYRSISSTLRVQVDTTEHSPSPSRLSHPHNVNTSQRDIIISQATCEEYHDNTETIKVEEDDASQYNVSSGMHDFGEAYMSSFEGNKDLGQYIEKEQILTGKKPRERKPDSSSDNVVEVVDCKTEQLIDDWYKQGEADNGIILAGQQDNYIQLDIRDKYMESFDDREDIVDSKCDIPETIDKVFVNEQYTRGCLEWGEENDKISERELDINNKEFPSREKNFQCLLCAKTFSKSHHLKMHTMTHTDKKLFQCLVCQKMFSNLSNLNKHKKIHTEEKPFQCLVCHKMFSQLANLKRHHIRIHKNVQPNL